eukprot:746391-Hanusia_phi.AAC.6
MPLRRTMVAFQMRMPHKSILSSWIKRGSPQVFVFIAYYGVKTLMLKCEGRRGSKAKHSA